MKQSLSEKRVLKVNSPQPPMGDPMGMGGGMPPMPPMGGPTPNDAPMPPMGGPTPPMGDDKSYDADFDAGVDANEEEDPKKFIQQLTGKLSQSLNKYQDSLPEPDVELDKYVASMTIAATVKGLDEKNANEIYKKIKDGAGADDDSSDDGGDMGDDMGGNGQMPMQNESRLDRIVNEVCREVLNTKDSQSILDVNNKRRNGKFNPYKVPSQFTNQK